MALKSGTVDTIYQAEITTINGESDTADITISYCDQGTTVTTPTFAGGDYLEGGNIVLTSDIISGNYHPVDNMQFILQESLDGVNYYDIDTYTNSQAPINNKIIITKNTSL